MLWSINHRIIKQQFESIPIKYVCEYKSSTNIIVATLPVYQIKYYPCRYHIFRSPYRCRFTYSVQNLYSYMLYYHFCKLHDYTKYVRIIWHSRYAYFFVWISCICVFNAVGRCNFLVVLLILYSFRVRRAWVRRTPRG